MTISNVYINIMFFVIMLAYIIIVFCFDVKICVKINLLHTTVLYSTYMWSPERNKNLI